MCNYNIWLALLPHSSPGFESSQRSFCVASPYDCVSTFWVTWVLLIVQKHAWGLVACLLPWPLIGKLKFDLCLWKPTAEGLKNRKILYLKALLHIQKVFKGMSALNICSSNIKLFNSDIFTVLCVVRCFHNVLFLFLKAWYESFLCHLSVNNNNLKKL